MKPSFDSSSAWLTATFATFGVLLTAVGIGTGDVPRVLRNHHGLAIVTFIAILVAAVFVVVAGWFASKGAEKVLIVGSTIALVVAAVAALLTGIASATESPEPAVTAQVVSGEHGASMLRFAVTDSGLHSSGRMSMLITAIPESTVGSSSPTVLYAAAMGPDSSGNVDHSGELAIPPAPDNDIEVQAWVGTRHTCKQEGPIASTGCIKLHITRLFEKPQLTLTWGSADHSGAGLTATVTAHDLANHRLVLSVIDQTTRHPHSLLKASWPSDSTGAVNESIAAIIPRDAEQLCVVASTTEATPSCTAPEGSGDATVVTNVPPA